jgi:PKD repeat protein
MKQMLRFAVVTAVCVANAFVANAQTGSIDLKDGSGTLISSYASVKEAIAAIPATVSQAYVIEIKSTYTGSTETYPITFTAKTGASATNTITLRPALGVVSAKIEASSTTSIISISDADWLRLDGRPGGVGNTKALTVSNTNTGANTTIEFINGATNNVLRYLNIVHASTASGGRSIYINTSASNTTGNSDNLVEHCKVDGGRYNVQFGGTTANPNRNNTFYGNDFINFTYTSLYSISTANRMVTYDSNAIHVVTPSTSTAITTGLFFTSFSDTAIITRNRIYDMTVTNSNTSNINGIYISATNGAAFTIANNMISLDGNSSSTLMNGIYILGSGSIDAKVYYNTIRIGGTLTSGGTSGNVVSAAIHKTNSSTASVYDFRNNILVNARTGGTSGTQHLALAVPNTNGTITSMDYNVFNAASNQLSRLGTTINTTIAGHQIAFGGGLGLNSNNASVSFVSNDDLHLAGGSLGDFDLKATPILSILNDIDNDPRGGSTYKGADDNPSFPILGKKNEIGVVSIDSPIGGSCGTPQDVKVTVRNFGINQVDTFTVNWTVNGTPQTPVISYAVLDTILGTGSITAQVSLGTISVSAGVIYDIKAWTSLPNNLIDPDKTNDSSESKFKLGLSGGTYTIGGTSPDFATLAAAVTEINNYGICGAVTFNIRTGTYTEQITINQIAGASATNTITFKSESGNKADVTISAPATTSVIDNFVINLNGADFIVIKDLTIERTGTGTYASAINIEGDVQNVTITNNILRGPTSIITDANGTRSGIFGAANATTKNLEIYNNLFDNNSNGVWLSTSTTNYSTGTRIYDNTINVHYTGVFVAGQYFPEIYKNKINRMDKTINVEFYGISLNLIDSAYNITRNHIESNRGYGIRLRSSNGYAGKEGLVTNNIVIMNYAGTSSVFGISNETGGRDQLYAHNTCYLNVDYTGSTSTTLGARVFYMPTTTANVYSNVRVLNNIFYSTTDGVAAWFTTNNIPAVTELDYNLYWAGVPNLTYVSAYLTDLAAYQTATGKAKNAYNFTLSFVSNTNAHISFMQKFAYGRNDLNINEDYDGDVRCASLPTIGADEYNSGLGAPTASFIGPNAAVTGDRAFFLFNGNANQLGIYKWYVNGVLANTGINLIYTFPTAGSYDVKMVAENCGGKDSTTKTYNVAAPSVAPTANFSADRNQIFLNEQINLTDLSIGGATAWHWSVTQDNGTNVIFSDSTEQDPSILFIEEGIYEICLITDNAVGSSAKRCRTAYIEVYPQTSMCLTSTSTFAKGKIYDDGGPSANYGINQNCTFFINPCASEVTLKFSEWTPTDVDDKLIIYDGDTTDPANIITTITGGMTNPGGTSGFTAKSGRMWLIWITDAATQNAGFAAEWSSVPVSVNPTVANFTIPDTLFEDSPADFINTSTGNGLTFSWDFDSPNFEPDDANNYGKTNPTKTYTSTGTYTITLESTNCLGSNTVSKNVVVVAPTVKPTPVDFTASLTKVNAKEITRLKDISGNGPDSWKWEITPSNGVIFLDPQTHRNPRVQFNFGGTYTVKLVTANVIGTDSLTKTNFIEVLEYCQPNVLKVNTDVTIRRVVFEGIDQSSDFGITKYSDFTGNNQIAKVAEGGSYTISIERNTNNELVNFAAWIDFNQDGDFTDANERVLFDSASTAQILTANVSIPANVLKGETRMRVAVSRANLTTEPCGPVVVGEFEDYKVTIGADDLAPVITLIGNPTPSVEVGYGYTDSGATAFDNVDGNITSKIVVTGSVDTLTVGTYTITYTVTDTVGNTTSVQRKVTITPDVTLPTITLNGNANPSIEMGFGFTDDGATAMDNLDGNITSKIVVTGKVDTLLVGEYILTYTITDAAGNSAFVQRKVNITPDVTAPIVSLNGADTITLNVFTPYVEAGVTAVDNPFGTNLSAAAIITGSVDVTKIGTYTLNYIVIDKGGNQVIISRTIIVQDIDKPTIALAGTATITHDAKTPYVDAGVTVTDNYDAVVPFTVSGNVDVNVLGAYTLVYKATDASGNVADSVVRTVNVVDRIAPTIKLIGNDLINLARWQNYTDAGYTLSDNFYDSAQVTVDVLGTWTNSLAEGSFYIQYRATDASGNVSFSEKRFIDVRGTNSVANVNAKATSVYPNPSNGAFVVENTNAFSAGTVITVTNILGAKVYELQPTQGSEKVNIDMQGTAAGIYFVNVISGNKTETTKIVVR